MSLIASFVGILSVLILDWVFMDGSPNTCGDGDERVDSPS